MVAYSFKPRFIPPILSGAKAQTIRADRRRHVKPGETMQLYTGMRTKACRLLGVATCLSAEPIRIRAGYAEIELAGLVVSDLDALDAFACTDGFEAWGGSDGMQQFWLRKHANATTEWWSGVLIKWGAFRAYP